MHDCGFMPPMSSLSDRNMRRGCDVATREKTMMLVSAVAWNVYLTHRVLMQLYVALGLHFGWNSQLNNSEMF